MMLGAALLVWAPPPGSLDDLYVVLADARAWLQGSGPAVEGSTSALDLLVKLVSLKVAPSADAVRLQGWLGLSLLLLMGPLTVLLARSWGARGPTLGLLGLGMVSSAGLVESAGYRLEGPLFALIWAMSLGMACDGRRRSVALAGVLLGLARPEGLVLLPFLLGWAWHRGHAAATEPAKPRDMIRGAAWGGCLALVLTLCRYAAYGDWLPNTFYAKSGPRLQEVAAGAAYLRAWLVSLGGVAIALLAAVVIAGGTRPGRARASTHHQRGTIGLLVSGLLYAVVVLLSGGDSYIGARLAMPVGVSLWLAAAHMLGTRGEASEGSRSNAEVGSVRGDAVGEGAGHRMAWIGALAALGIQVFAGLPRPWPGLRAAAGIAVAGVTHGPMGEEAFEGDDAVFASVVRALGGEVFAHRHAQRFRWYEPSASILDLTGLTDREVARRPAVGSVRFGRDAIDLALGRGVGAIHLDASQSRARSQAALPLVPTLSDPAIAVDFAGPPSLAPDLAAAVAVSYRAASKPHPGGGYFNLLVRRDLGASFEREGFRLGP